MEYFVISKMLEQGLDVYIPLIDDFAIDAVIRKKDGSFVEVQIKARSKDVKFGDAALFAAITHEHRENYYFVFYSHRLDKMWILSSEDFINEAVQNKTGKNQGMVLLNDALFDFVKKGVVSAEEAYVKSIDKAELQQRFQQENIKFSTNRLHH